MSFGYSVGDFIAALDLTIKLYNAFKSAPNEFAEISRELESFSVVLSSLRDQAGDPGSVLNRNVTAKRSELMVLCDNLVTTMQELQELYQRYEKMGRSKVSWLRRVRLGMEDLHSLRSKLTFHMSAISAFVANLNTATLARMEPMLERIWNILDEQMKCGAAKAQTILSISTKSESVGAAWAMLKMNLRTEGIPLDYIEQNAESIIEVAVAAAELNVIVDGSDGGTVLPDDSISQVGVGKTEIQQAKDSRENNTIARDEEPIQISQLEVQNHQGEGKRSISLELKPTSGSSSSAITQSLEASLSSELSSSFMSMSPPSSTSKSPLREYVGKWKSSAGAQSQRLLDALGGNPQEGLYPSVKSTRLVIAIEYGVEFTAVAFAFPRRMNNASFDDISVVEDWGPQMKLSSKIPSAISYSPAISPLDQQWGASLSEDALVITNTKLELENSGSKEGLLGSISRLLEGTSNLAFEYIKTSKGIDNYPWKSPEEIVTDYLTHVFQYLMASFEFLNPRLLSKISTDIVISVPAQWTYHGHNSLFRAVTNSGFNKSSFPSLADLIMVAEGDALAMGALREVQERFGHNSFKDDEFIMLCECGNDTTEVTIYKVKSLSGTLQLELITEAKSTQCGYKDVNQNFQKWLRKVIGDHKYRVLVPKAVGRYSSSDGNWSLSMRRVMNRFEDQKKAFSYGRGFNYSIELPNRLWRHDRVQDGTLTISNEAMRTFFDPWITAALRLIEQQLGEFENSGGTITKILLVEDCNRSGTPYLQEAARTALSSAEVIFSSGAKWYTASVQGSVMYGVEKIHHRNLCVVESYSRNYGMFLQSSDESMHMSSNREDNGQRGRYCSLIRRGDLLLPDHHIEVNKCFSFTMSEIRSGAFEVLVCEMSEENDLDRQEDGSRMAMPEGLHKLAALKCDLLKFCSPDDILRIENLITKDVQHLVHCSCTVALSGSKLSVHISCNGYQVGRTSFILDSHYKDILLVVPSSVGCSRGPEHPFQSEGARIDEMASASTLHRLLGLIRRKYKLDHEIWSLKNVEVSERYLVEEKMQDADQALREIIQTIDLWEDAEELWEDDKELWSKSELEQVREIKNRVLGEGKKWWVGNPPWNDAE